jgi:hypothetical protein
MSQYDTRSAVVRTLAARFRGRDLAASAAAKCAVELTLWHADAGHIPTEAIDQTVARFSEWLHRACDTSAPPVSDGDAVDAG